MNLLIWYCNDVGQVRITLDSVQLSCLMLHLGKKKSFARRRLQTTENARVKPGRLSAAFGRAGDDFAKSSLVLCIMEGGYILLRKGRR
jgi:hypothetical protein